MYKTDYEYILVKTFTQDYINENNYSYINNSYNDYEHILINNNLNNVCETISFESKIKLQIKSHTLYCSH